MIALGKWGISDKKFSSPEAIENYLEGADWQMITNICGLIVEHEITEHFNKHHTK